MTIHEADIDAPVLKRVVDFSVALLLLLLLAPLLVLFVGSIYLSMLARPCDRGPLFYRERRISKGQPFEILKFRVLTMAALETMKAQGKHARLLEDDADNLTWAGRVLIKPCYLDEVPQLYNILKGEMSLVGPRPWPVSMVEDQVANGVTYRNRVMAGWTGPAQLEKRVGGNMSLERSEVLDWEYIQGLTTRSGFAVSAADLRMVAATVRVMLQRKGLEN